MNAETAMAIHEMLGEGYRPVDFLTARGTHMGCGECCSRMLPVTDGELKVLKDAVRERGVALRPERAEVDLTCPLLDDGGMCMLYDVRPLICRLYDCSEHARGTIRRHPLMGRSEVVDLREALG